MKLTLLSRLSAIAILLATFIGVMFYSKVVNAQLVVDGPGHQVTAGRSTVSLNGAWRFETDPASAGSNLGYQNQSFNDASWTNIDVPGSWSLYDETSDYIGDGWYRRTVSRPSHSSGERVRLRFEAAYYDTDVWFNGQFLGNHTGGYTPFEFDVTDLLQATNTIAVRTDNTFSIGAWYFWGGLTRDVSFIVDPEVRIVRQKFISDPDLPSGQAQVSTNVTIENSSISQRTVQVTGQFTNLQGDASSAVTLSPLNGAANSLTIPAGQTRSLRLAATLTQSDYDLWHFDDPNLYRSNVSISSGGYTVSDRVGIRKIELVGTDFLLNGEKIRLNGYNRVSDDRANGAIEPLYVVRRDIDRMKAAGANLSRIMHHAQHPSLLDYADEKGMLLTAEVPVWGNDADLSIANGAQVYTDIDELLQRDWNHASIFAWSVANEIQSGTNAGRTFVSTMMNYIRAVHDSTRFLTFSTNKNVSTTEASQFSDFVSRNSYQNWLSASNRVNQSFPNRPLYISEYSPDGFTFPTSRERLNHTTGAPNIYEDYATQPWIFGTSVWAYNDYRSTFRGTSVNATRGWGLQNQWGDLKEAYFQMQKVASPVNDLSVTPLAEGTGVSFSAKTLVELPAFTLRNYKVVVQGVDQDGNVVGGGIFDLQDISPQGESFDFQLNWNKSGLNIVEERASIVTPTGYEVDVSRAAISAPKQLAAEQVIPSGTSIRVVFDRVAGATSYELSVDGTNISASTKLENFLDVSGLSRNRSYTLRLKAINSQGESVRTVNASTLNSTVEIAPVIQSATPISGGVVVGYIVGESQVSWDVEVQRVSNNNVVRSYNTLVKGASRVTGLAANVDHRVRVRGVFESGSNTVWSEWLNFRTFNQSTRPSAPVFKGVVAGSNSIAASITPHPQAEYYTIRLARGNSVITERVDLAAVDNLLVEGLINNAEYDVSVRVHTSTGVSLYSPISKVITSTPNVGTSDRIEIIADNLDSETQIVGSWSTSTFSGERIGPNYLHDGNSGKGSKSVTFNPAVTESGNYTVFAYWNASPDRADNVPISITHAGGTDVVIVDQTANGGAWFELGRYDLASDGSTSITVSNSGTSDTVVADAVRLLANFDSGAGEAEHTLILDNSDSATQLVGSWTTSTFSSDRIGANYLHDNRTGKGSKSVIYNPVIPATGSYTVAVYWNSSADRATNVPVTIAHNGGSATVQIDQTAPGGQWVDVGSFNFSQGSGSSVTISNAGTSSFVIADAVRFTSNFVSSDSTLYELRTRHDKCLGVSSGLNNANLRQVTCIGSDFQRFQLTELGNGLVSIQPLINLDLCLDVQGASTENRANVQAYACGNNPTPNRRFTLTNRGGTLHSIEASHSGKCLDLQGGGEADFTNIFQWACNPNNSNQHFSLIPVQ